jgi:hypothetical protein
VPPVGLSSCFSLHDAIKQLFTTCFCINYWQAEIVDHTTERRNWSPRALLIFRSKPYVLLLFVTGYDGGDKQNKKVELGRLA